MHPTLGAEIARTRSEELLRDAESTGARELARGPGLLARLVAKYWTREHARHEQPVRWASWRARRM
jgi:hypothetical protein